MVTMVALGALRATDTAVAAQASVVPTYGAWEERDMKLPFEIRPSGAKGQLILIVPKDVTFPGRHDYVMTADKSGLYKGNGADRPAAELSFVSPSLAKLKLHGGGSTPYGAWLAVNDYILVKSKR
jgi:hypothetical protein